MRLDPADPGYALLVRQPLLFSAADAVIGPDCRVDGLSLRAPLPGCGHQGLHPDFFLGHRTSGPWQVLAAMWCHRIHPRQRAAADNPRLSSFGP